jgi:hypothetical protein
MMVDGSQAVLYGFAVVGGRRRLRAEVARRVRVRALLIGVVVGLGTATAGACGSEGTGTSPQDRVEQDGRSDEPVAPPPMAVGEDGVAIVDVEGLHRVEGLPASPYATTGSPAVPAFGDRIAVVSEGQVALIGPGGDAVVADCAECSGVAATAEHVITTRRNGQPGEGFDIVLLTEDLEVAETVAATRASEPVNGTPSGENSASPVTLAASEDRVVVGYLSVNGGVRAGPTVVAAYSYDGELLDHMLVSGLLGLAAPSPDGEHLAVGVGGSGGACITSSALEVIALDGLEVLGAEPAVPAEVMATFDDLGEPWLYMVDVAWTGTAVRTVGEVYRTGWAENASGEVMPGPDTSCEVPEFWVRTFDIETGAFTDVRSDDVVATRWIGPGCSDVVEIRRSAPGESVLVAVQDGRESTLGRYSQLALGETAADRC